MTKLMSSVTYRKLLTDAVLKLKSNEIADADIDARLLMEYVFDINRSFILAHGEDVVEDEDKIMQYNDFIEKRSEHIPLQHLTGVQEFMGLEFKVSDKVLIPRQDTECLVEEAMIYISDGMKVVDMCTGSGCIAISLCKYKNNLEMMATDLSEAALKIASENAKKHGVQIDFRCGYMFSVIEPDVMFDAIVSNPPYIRSEEIDNLMEEVRDHEPYIALDGYEDGLHFYRILAINGMSHLNYGGMIFLEIGYDQGEDVSKILESAGFTDIKVVKDYSGNDRVVIGRKGLVDK